MSQPLQLIRELIKELPGKDASLCEKFLENRNFEAILEITDSDIYKARRAASVNLSEEDSITGNSYIDNLIELKSALEDYMSLIEVPDNSSEYDDY